MPTFERRGVHGLWTVRFFETVDGKKVNRRLSGFKTKAAAENGYREYMQSFKHREPPRKNEKIVFFDHLLQRYLDARKADVKESTYYSYENKINKHIYSYFEGMRISEITPAVLLAWQNSLSDYAYKYRRDLRIIVSSIFKFGEQIYDLPNCVAKLPPIRNTDPKKEMKVWTKEQFEHFISHCEHEVYRAFFKFLYHTGCRKGEARALTFSDINIGALKIRINKNITRNFYREDAGDDSWAITTPKNDSSYRDVDISEGLLQNLLSLKKRDDQEYVFMHNDNDRPLPLESIRRYFKDTAATAELPEIRIHDLRHSSASYLISKGASVVAVSKRLGHSSIDQTLNTYSHVMPEDLKKINDLLDG